MTVCNDFGIRKKSSLACVIGFFPPCISLPKGSILSEDIFKVKCDNKLRNLSSGLRIMKHFGPRSNFQSVIKSLVSY